MARTPAAARPGDACHDVQSVARREFRGPTHRPQAGTAIRWPRAPPARYPLLAVGATRAFPTLRMCRQRVRRPAPRRPAAPGRRHVAFVAEQPEKRRSETRGDQQMPATLKLTHKAIGAEVRRGTYDVVVDGERAGSVEMNHTIEIQSSLDVTPCKFAIEETRAALKPSTPPRKRSSPSDAPERDSCRSFSHPLPCPGWH